MRDRIHGRRKLHVERIPGVPGHINISRTVEGWGVCALARHSPRRRACRRCVSVTRGWRPHPCNGSSGRRSHTKSSVCRNLLCSRLEHRFRCLGPGCRPFANSGQRAFWSVERHHGRGPRLRGYMHAGKGYHGSARGSWRDADTARCAGACVAGGTG